MKDVFGNDLAIGDKVAFYAPGYRSMVMGHVIAFTPKQVRVKYINTWNYGGSGVEKTYLNYPSDFAKDTSNSGPNESEKGYGMDYRKAAQLLQNAFVEGFNYGVDGDDIIAWNLWTGSEAEKDYNELLKMAEAAEQAV